MPLTKKKTKSSPSIEHGEDLFLDSKTPKQKNRLITLLLVATAFPLLAQTSTTVTTTSPVVTAPTPVVTQSVTTSTTTVQARTLYLRSSYDGQLKNGSQVFIRPNGRIYNQAAERIGHLTDLDGNDLTSIPDDHHYKIRNLSGAVIASTNLSSAFDSDRTISLARENGDGQIIVETTSTTTAPVVPTTTVQSTTTTTTQPAPAPQPSP